MCGCGRRLCIACAEKHPFGVICPRTPTPETYDAPSREHLFAFKDRVVEKLGPMIDLTNLSYWEVQAAKDALMKCWIMNRRAQTEAAAAQGVLKRQREYADRKQQEEEERSPLRAAKAAKAGKGGGGHLDEEETEAIEMVKVKEAVHEYRQKLEEMHRRDERALAELTKFMEKGGKGAAGARY